MCSLQMSNFGPIKMPVGAAYLRSQIMTSSRQSSTRAYFAFRKNAKSPLMDVKNSRAYFESDFLIDNRIKALESIYAEIYNR